MANLCGVFGVTAVREDCHTSPRLGHSYEHVDGGAALFAGFANGAWLLLLLVGLFRRFQVPGVVTWKRERRVLYFGLFERVSIVDLEDRARGPMPE